MPFKNKADKLAWRRQYKVRFPEKHKAWRESFEAKLLAAKKEYSAVIEARKSTRRYAEIQRLVGLACNEIRLRIMERDGLCKCYGCQGVFNNGDMSKVNKGRGTSGTCRKCATEQTVRWAKQNPDRHRASVKAKYHRHMRDPQRRLKARLRDRQKKAIRGYAIGTRQTGGMMRYLGCSLADAVKHIEAQFKPGMAWTNHSMTGWHIDHIRPLASYDLTQEEQRKAAFHYSNLQPLWAADNLRKSDKRCDSVSHATK